MTFQNPQPPPSPSACEVPSDHRQWAMIAHLSALVGGLLTSVFGGWGTFFGPLLIWLLRKDEMPFVDQQGKEALNFNITVAIVAVALSVMSAFFTFATLGLGLIIVVPLGAAFVLAWVIVVTIAAVKANEGVAFRYPARIRFIR